MYAEGGRVELSGATAANWVAKSANLLVDSLGAPARVGLALPLHWQTVCLLLAGVAADATVVLAEDPADLAGCDVAFVLAPGAEAGLAAGVDEVLALSGHPMGAPVSGSLPAMVSDYARDVPGHGDHFGGPPPQAARLVVGGSPVLAAAGFGPDDRVLTSGAPTSAQGAGVLLGALAAGSSLVLLPDSAGLDLAALVRDERVTRSYP